MKNKSEKVITFGHTLNVVFNKLFYFFLSLFVIYLIKKFIFKSLDISIHSNDFFWWMIIFVNFIGYFLGRFGMISRGRKRPTIQAVGWIVLIISLILMWFQFSFGQFLILVAIFIFLTRTLVEGIMEIIYRKLFAEEDKAFAKYIGMTPEKIRFDHELDNYEDPDKIVEDFLQKNNIKKTINFSRKGRSEDPIIFGVELTQKHYPKLRKWALENPETLKKQVQSIADAWHNGNTTSAIQMLESDLEHG